MGLEFVGAAADMEPRGHHLHGPCTKGLPEMDLLPAQGLQGSHSVTLKPPRAWTDSCISSRRSCRPALGDCVRGRQHVSPGVPPGACEDGSHLPRAVSGLFELKCSLKYALVGLKPWRSPLLRDQDSRLLGEALISCLK